MKRSVESLAGPIDRSKFSASSSALCIGAVLMAGLVAQRLTASEEVQGPSEPPLTAQDREHWAYRPVRRPEVPDVRDVAWCRTTIDRFLRARLEAQGLAPQPEAAKLTLLRRVTFDLTGLPPTPAEISEYLADASPTAYERVVDRLLDSPAHGERWAQHWLDLARFAETDGFEHDLPRPNAWRYRDWVIDALNRDLPYDEFLRLQLAGDLIAPEESQSVIATGFLLCGPDMPDINLQEERRHIFLNDLTGTVGSIVLGLQMGCASCHDHKYDPISQFDFYRLRAFFEPLEIFKDHPLPVGAEVAPRSSAERELAAKLQSAEAEVEQLEEGVKQKLVAENPDLQPTQDDLLKALAPPERERHAELSKSIAELRKQVKPDEPALGRVVRELAANVKPAKLYLRGDFRREGPEVHPAFPRVVMTVSVTNEKDGGDRTPATDRGELAKWLTRPDHPLTARVIVNRIWQHHFGRGLVETGSDFGKAGTDPTHPELLDWLASEFPRQGWSLKWLHRQIVTSATYRQRSQLPPDADVAARDNWNKAKGTDSDNKLLWRMSRQRLDGEAIRDSMLVAGGRLNARRGGPGVRPPLPKELLATLLKDQWNVTPDERDHDRRSIYLFVRRNLRYPLFEAFDRPDTNASCSQRNRSTIAPQALLLLNSELSLSAARDLAGAVYSSVGADSAALIRHVYRVTLGREPAAEELEAALDFLRQQSAKLRDAGRAGEELALPRPVPDGVDRYDAAAFVDFCLAVFNLNEFVYVD